MNLYVNGYQSRDTSVKCGVRQGDLISCPLFVAAIECLACCTNKDDRISSSRINGQRVKALLYADDTAVLVRSQQEADITMEWLDLYGRASGAKVNWGKSYLLQVGEPGIHIPEVREVSPENPYHTPI